MYDSVWDFHNYLKLQMLKPKSHCSLLIQEILIKGRSSPNCLTSKNISHLQILIFLVSASSFEQRLPIGDSLAFAAWPPMQNRRRASGKFSHFIFDKIFAFIWETRQPFKNLKYVHWIFLLSWATTVWLVIKLFFFNREQKINLIINWLSG